MYCYCYPFSLLPFQDLFYLFSAAKSRKRVRLVIINWKETEILIKNYRSNGIVEWDEGAIERNRVEVRESGQCYPFGKNEMQWKRINNKAKLSFAGRCVCFFFLFSDGYESIDIYIYIWNWMLFQWMNTQIQTDHRKTKSWCGVEKNNTIVTRVGSKCCKIEI